MPHNNRTATNKTTAAGTRTTRTTKTSRTDTTALTTPTTDQVIDTIQQQKKRKRPDLTESMTPHTDPGEMSDMLSKAMTISHWPDIDTNNPEQVADRIDLYHRFCLESDMKPSVVGLSMALGCDRSTLWKWENGVESHKPQAVRNLIKKGREVNELMMVQLMQNGKINPVTGIFLLKNNHGYKDQQDIVVTPNNQYDQKSDEELATKYLTETVKADGTIE